MSFKKWVIQRRALRFGSGSQASAAVKERYRGTVLSVVKFLHTQRVQAGDVRLVLKTGEANIKALGYIYGFTDAAFQIAGMDIGSEYGVSALVAVISELDRPNADILWHRLKCPGDARALMDGVRIGFDDYCKLLKSRKQPVNVFSGGRSVFRREIPTREFSDPAESEGFPSGANRDSSLRAGDGGSPHG